jgi:nicotinamide mononucleotide transporter
LLALVEFGGVLTGFVCVWLTIRQHIWCWPVGILNVVLFLVLFYHTRLYADMGLQVVYIFLQIYGWHQWLRGGPQRSTLAVSRIGRALALALACLGTAATVAMGWGLATYTDADLPYWDSLTTVMSLIAQYLLARKVLENWLVWISADVLFIGIYTAKQLYLTAALYAVFLVMATAGFLRWRKDLKPAAAPPADGHPPPEPDAGG